MKINWRKNEKKKQQQKIISQTNCGSKWKKQIQKNKNDN